MFSSCGLCMQRCSRIYEDEDRVSLLIPHPITPDVPPPLPLDIRRNASEAVARQAEDSNSDKAHSRRQLSIPIPIRRTLCSVPQQQQHFPIARNQLAVADHNINT
eukprot:TRINITY_DN4335_c0_g2_i5.p1 TRINITY_DN4335_c0_g2~~TRINITY_DN4335_c0_g2_i5.p1  ORF type:complete len:105 (-),score=2.69 TRINITY_DN4335_c0_g2_i5:261-575(-)